MSCSGSLVSSFVYGRALVGEKHGMKAKNNVPSIFSTVLVEEDGFVPYQVLGKNPGHELCARTLLSQGSRGGMLKIHHECHERARWKRPMLAVVCLREHTCRNSQFIRCSNTGSVHE